VRNLYLNIYAKIAFILAVNWYKTFYINFKKLPFKEARKLPIIVFGRLKIHSLEGEIVFKVPVEFGLIGMGQRYEIFTKSKGTAELYLLGTIECHGRVQLGVDFKLFVHRKALLRFGNINSFATDAKIIAYKRIVLGDFVQFGAECQLIDTNFHYLKNTETNERYPRENDIVIGNYNFIGARTTLSANTVTPDYCMVASNSLCNKNYCKFGSHIIIGGIPSALLKEQVTRDWQAEEKEMIDYLTIKF